MVRQTQQVQTKTLEREIKLPETSLPQKPRHLNSVWLILDAFHAGYEKQFELSAVVLGFQLEAPSA